ncbi:MAG TPA: hypothetical protein VIL84_03835 [Devosiaceae bacterium]
MKSIAYWFIGLATLFALAGMAFGIYMSATGVHDLAPAHAHNNLIGYVTMMLYGLYYKVVPQATRGTLPVVHFWVSLLGALTMGVGVGLAISMQGELLAQIASFATIIGMAIFAVIVWRHRAELTAA